MAIKIEITGTKKLCDFKHMFSPIDSPNEITPIKSKGFYFICGNWLKNNIYRDQIYFLNTENELFYYSCFNEWKRSNNKQEHFINLLKLV